MPSTTQHRVSTASTDDSAAVALLHGAGYVGRELIQLLSAHPHLRLAVTTSRTFAGEPISTAHSSLRGQSGLVFTDPDDWDASGVDAVLVAAEHGQSMHLVPELRSSGFDGPIVDLSADFRYETPDLYTTWFGIDHPAPGLLDEAVYGLPEWMDASESGLLVANPGCFATGIELALAPLAKQGVSFTAHVTALTGASGSGATPSEATHFPDREGNVRPYKVLSHQHAPEIVQTLGEHVTLDFVPASGPWTRGIWGTAHIEWANGVSAIAASDWFAEAYEQAPFVRCTPGTLPSLQPVVNTPFCDVGWQTDGDAFVVGFALDNLLKGAASQAIQNLNRTLGLSEATGLVPEPVRRPAG